MRYLSENDVTQMMGIGYLGEVRQGPDGQLYQYVQGVDGLGNPIGFWRRLKRFARRVVKKALPIAKQFAPFIPGGAAALTAVTPFLKQAGVAGYEGIGELYEAPDGSLYQVQGVAEDEDLHGIDEDPMTQMMGIGYLGEVRQGPDGNLYQYMQGMDGLGNPIGFWGKLRKLGRRVLKYHPAAMALRAAARPILKKAGVAGYAGLSAPCQIAEDASYQMQGLADDDDLQGLDDDEELRGFDEDDELRGLEDDEELRGFADDEELRGFDEDSDMQGYEGYVRQDGMSGLERFEPAQPPQTRWHVPPSQPPEIWKPLW
jgi:hypothetical protein